MRFHRHVRRTRAAQAYFDKHGHDDPKGWLLALFVSFGPIIFIVLFL